MERTSMRSKAKESDWHVHLSNVISFTQQESSKCDTHEVPQRAERGNTRLLAALHDLRITVVVRGDEDNCQGHVSAASMAQ
jgi:hypothetical protein